MPKKKADPVVAPAELIAATTSYPMAGADQIPMVLAPKIHMAAWTGGDGDYERALAVKGVGAIKIGKGNGLVIRESASMAFWPTATGGLIVIWIGARSITGCIAAALSITTWKPEKAKLVVVKGAETLVLFDCYSRGSELRPDGRIGFERNHTVTFDLAPGSYAIDSCWNWEGRVKVGRKIEDTMIGALRLRR